MVQDIVDTVENYNEEGRFPEPFASRIHQKNLSFGDARRLIHETVAENRIPLPNRVDLFNHRVRGWRRTQQNINTNVNTTNQIRQT